MDALKPPPGRKKPDLTLDDLRTINARPEVQLAELDRAVARAEAIGAEAATDRAQLDAARPALLLTGTDAQLAQHDDAAAAITRQGERAAALAAALRERAEDARAALAEVERVKRYDAAAALVAALPAAVEAEYRDLVRVGRSIVERIARAHVAVAAVNADLPEGWAALPNPEGFRSLPDQPKRVVSARRVSLYVESNGQVIEDQSRVKPRWSVDAQGRPQADKSTPQAHPADLGFAGQYKVDAYGKVDRSTKGEVHVRRQSFVEYESVAAVTHPHVPSFAGALKIPALFDLQPEAWNFNGRGTAIDVLQALARPLDPIAPPQAAAPVFDRRTLDRFEQEWGATSKLGVAVEDGTAEAARRQSDDRHGGYQAFRPTREVTGHVDPSGSTYRSYIDRYIGFGS